MKQLRVICWFIDSEEFVAKLICKEGLFGLQIRKTIDPARIISSRGMNYWEQYDFFGKEEDVDKLAKFLENSDFDVEVIRIES